MSKEILQEFDPLTKGNKLALNVKNDADTPLNDKQKDTIEEELYNRTDNKPYISSAPNSSDFGVLEQNDNLATDNTTGENDNVTETPIEQNNSKDSDEDNNEEQDTDLYDFQLFIKQLKDPRADPLVRYIKSFLKNFCTQRPLWTASEQVKLIFDFKKFIYGKFNYYEPFKSLKTAQFKNAKEGLEKLIMGKLYTRCFSPKFRQLLKIELDNEHQDDIDNDSKLHGKINEFKFIELKNLDLPIIAEAKLNQFIKLASNELNKINKFKSPRDKLICILNCCKIIFGLLRYNNLEKEGADSFIPLLIFIIIKSDITHLVSNVNYIERFRFEELNTGEQSYYLSSLQGAINFILELDFDNLTIKDKTEFERQYQENQVQLISSTNLKSKNDVDIEENELGIIQSNAQPINIPSLEDVTTSIGSIFTDFISQYNTTGSYGNTVQDTVLTKTQTQEEEIEEEKKIQKIIANLEAKEHKETLETLSSMFPDIDSEILEDICIAKKYRMGECVDTLLALFN